MQLFCTYMCTLMYTLKLLGLIKSINLKNKRKQQNKIPASTHRTLSLFSYEFQKEDHKLNQRQSYPRKVTERIW